MLDMQLLTLQSAFIGSSMALKSFKDEFSLTGHTKQQSDLLSANIVSCYRKWRWTGVDLCATCHARAFMVVQATNAQRRDASLAP